MRSEDKNKRLLLAAAVWGSVENLSSSAASGAAANYAASALALGRPRGRLGAKRQPQAQRPY